MQAHWLLANLLQVNTQAKDNVKVLNAKKGLTQKSQVQKSARIVRLECSAMVLDLMITLGLTARKVFIVQQRIGSIIKIQ